MLLYPIFVRQIHWVIRKRDETMPVPYDIIRSSHPVTRKHVARMLLKCESSSACSISVEITVCHTHTETNLVLLILYIYIHIKCIYLKRKHNNHCSQCTNQNSESTIIRTTMVIRIIVIATIHDNIHNLTKIRRFPKMVVSKMVALFYGKSHLEMDDDWGYPFRKPRH